MAQEVMQAVGQVEVLAVEVAARSLAGHLAG
jgi:hypothetical protein